MFTEVEIRILGCLIEKESTTPEYYPLSLNALKNACNQKSNRDPVVAYDEAMLKEGIRRLQSEGLVLVASGAGQRVRKYVHKFKDKFAVSRPGQALMCLLLLRGPQTVGELRLRTDRIYQFGSREEVEDALNDLIDRDQPLVVRLPRQPGRKEHRYTHLLGGESPAETLEKLSEDSAVESELSPEERLEQFEKTLNRLRHQMDALSESFRQFRESL